MTNLEALKLYQRWRTSQDMTTMEELGLNPFKIDRAINWAIKQLDSRLTEKSRDHFVAQIKAQGAREALKRAMSKPGFSSTVVRVDRLEAVIADMEKGDE